MSDTQLLFPFVLDFYMPQYVRREVPYILEKKREYVIRTHEPISNSVFMIEHYCNKKSSFYGAQQYFDDNNPYIHADGEIIR